MRESLSFIALRVNRALPLVLICLAHAGLLWWMHMAIGQTTPVLVPPSVVGVLVSHAPVSEPEPLPVAPEPEPPKPITQPEPSPLPPPPKAPPSERAVSPPPPEPPTDLAAADSAAAAAAQAASESGDGEPIIPPHADASMLNNPAPIYPSVSRRLREQGRVLLDVYILPDGRVGEIKLKQSSGHARLDEAALEAVRRWRYVPARRGDTPIPYWYVQPIDFALAQRALR